MTTPPPTDLLCFSHLRWNFVFQRPQHLMSRWARERRVWFIEEPHGEASEQAYLEVRRSPENVNVVTPHLPAGVEVRETLELMLADFLAEHAISDYVAWYYTPLALDFTNWLKPRAVVYDCMDELSAFKGASLRMKERERDLCARADLVFTGGQSLYEAKRFLHRSVHAFPSAVDVPHFARARSIATDPADQQGIPHPRLGFFGVIDERLDIDLIAGLAARRPDWHIVLVGPVVKIDPAALPQAPNIHYVGGKDYSELPDYLAGWDVAILPFARNDSTRFISPTKTPEYLAGGKPVISTSIRDVVRPYGEMKLAEIADTPEEFERAADYLLAMDPEPRRKQADEFLATISWDRTFASMRALVDEVVANKSGPSGGATRNGRPEKRSRGDGGEQRTAPRGMSGGVSARGGSYDSPRRGRPHFDCLVVGAGFAGAVAAERLASAGGKSVLICDVRPHIGGNAYDHHNSDGILIHRYGPHIFHTNSDDVFHYLSGFTKWRPYEHRVLAQVDGQLLPIPINLDTVNRLYGWKLDSAGLEEFFRTIGEPRAKIETSEDVIISKVGRELYEKFFRNYTRKQWGLDPSELDSSVIARIPVRTCRDDRYFTDKHQAMPLDGFTAMFQNMLSHPNITVVVGVDYRELVGKVRFDKLIYTGPVDEFFDYAHGKLPYRALEFRHETIDTEQLQPVAVVNYPNEHDYTRVTEFKHLSGQKHAKTAIVYEYPRAEGDPYYPVPRPENAALYRRYEKLAEAQRGVHFCGRLATYRYYNMDQVCAQALTLSSRLLGVERKQLLANVG
jgi:UDP-galactopyranose mutase